MASLGNLNLFGSGDTNSQLEETCGALSLSRTQRLYGFGAMFAIGFALSIVGSIFLFTGQIELYAVFYTFGNLCSLFSTGFLVGPIKQCKNMFDSTRIIATGVYLGLMVLTLVLAFTLGRPAAGACLVCVCLQWIALMWYSLSYVPYARAGVKQCVTGMCNSSA